MASEAEAQAAITKGALLRIYANEEVNDPVLQCIHTKQLDNKSGNSVERHRIVLSDVDNFIQCMLGTQLNHLMQQNIMNKGCCVRVKQFQTSEIKGKKVMIILDCEVMGELGVHPKMGNPIALEETAAGGKAKDGGADGTKQETPQNGISGNNFYGAKQEPQSQQRSLPSRSGPTSSSRGNIYPIEAISPYAHQWTIKARCTMKSEIKKWHKASGEGKLFSCNFLDETDEIRATAFNNECDMLYDVIQEGSVYYVSFPCQVKLANKKFSNLSNDYELTFERGTIVEKAEDEDSVPKAKYNFTTLADVQNVEKDSTIDTIAVLKDIGEVSQITSKTTSKPYDKRDLTLVDNTGFSIRLTIWGGLATSFDVAQESVVAFKGVKVSDFNGRSLSLLSSGSLTANPDLDDAYRLKGWYDDQGRNDSFTSHAAVLGTSNAGGRKDQYKTIAAAREENLGMTETADYFTLKATVVYIKLDGTIAYSACRSENCNKKVIEENPGEWRCERCDKNWDRPEYRYMLSVNVADWTGSIWLSLFDDTGRLVFGISADEMVEMKDNDDAKYRETVAAANCKTWVFRVRAKLDTYQEQQRVRYQVSSAQPVNYTSEATRLAEILKQYNLQDDNSSMFVQ